MRGTGIPWIYELLLSAMELFHKKHSLPSSSTSHNVGSSRASGEQNSAQSPSECAGKWNLSCGAVTAKVKEAHAWHTIKVRFVSTFGEAIQCRHSLPVIGVIDALIAVCS